MAADSPDDSGLALIPCSFSEWLSTAFRPSALVLRCEASEGTAVPQREQSVSIVQFLTVKTDDILLHFMKGTVLQNCKHSQFSFFVPDI